MGMRASPTPLIAPLTPPLYGCTIVPSKHRRKPMTKIDATPSTAFTYLRDVITRLNRQYTPTYRAYLELEAKDSLSFSARLDGRIKLQPLTLNAPEGFVEIAKVSISPDAHYDGLKIEPADTTEWRYARVLNDIINSVVPQAA